MPKRENRAYQSRPLPLCSLSCLPLEVQYLIIDQLDSHDVPKLRKAVRWPISCRYWRSRAPKELIHELWDVPIDDPMVDWEYLCLNAERLSESRYYSTLLRRRKILVRFQKPRVVFRELLRKQVALSWSGIPRDGETLDEPDVLGVLRNVDEVTGWYHGRVRQKALLRPSFIGCEY